MILQNNTVKTKKKQICYAVMVFMRLKVNEKHTTIYVMQTG